MTSTTEPSTKAESPLQRRWMVPLALVAGVVAIAFAAIFFRLAQPTHPLVASGFRLSVATLLLFPLLLRGIRRGTLDTRQLRAGLLAGLLYGLHFGSWVWSLELTTVAASVTLVTATPLFLATLGLITGRDRPSQRLLVALTISSLGIVMIGWHDLQTQTDARALLGDGLAALGAIAMAFYLLLVRRFGDSLDVWAFMAMATLGGATSLFYAAWFAGVPLQIPSANAALFLVLAALLPQLVGHGCLTWVLRHVSPTTVGVATLAEPIGASLLAYWILDESLSGSLIVAALVVLSGVGLALYDQARRAAP